MSCPFLKPHECKGCQDDWRCDGSIVPFRLVDENDEPVDISACLSEEYVDCPNYKDGLAVRELARNLKLSAKKRDKRIEIAMKELDGILKSEENDAERLVKLKELYRARLRDLHEYKAELRRCKGERDGAQ
jgi:hypothetical protein